MEPRYQGSGLHDASVAAGALATSPLGGNWVAGPMRWSSCGPIVAIRVMPLT